MNEDEKFFTQFREAPRPEFTAAVYERINQPMNAQKKQINLRQKVLAFAMTCVLLLATVLAYPPARAQAYSFLRQIGVIQITTQQSEEPGPTAEPPDPAQKPLTATSPEAASELAGFQVLAPASLPEGFTTESAYTILPNGNGKLVVSQYTHLSGNNFILINQYRYADGDAFTNSVSGQESVQDVQVRGQKGVWITGRLMTNPSLVQPGSAGQDSLRSTGWLYWEENGVVYVIMSDGLSLDETLQLAQNLQ